MSDEVRLVFGLMFLGGALVVGVILAVVYLGALREMIQLREWGWLVAFIAFAVAVIGYVGWALTK